MGIYLEAKRRNIRKANILTDSKSAISRVCKAAFLYKTSKIELECKRMAKEINDMDGDVRITWIPSHTGIPRNDIADELANKGREMKSVSNVKRMEK